MEAEEERSQRQKRTGDAHAAAQSAQTRARQAHEAGQEAASRAAELKTGTPPTEGEAWDRHERAKAREAEAKVDSSAAKDRSSRTNDELEGDDESP